MSGYGCDTFASYFAELLVHGHAVNSMADLNKFFSDLRLLVHIRPSRGPAKLLSIIKSQLEYFSMYYRNNNEIYNKLTSLNFHGSWTTQQLNL